ncbi:hypothetical protein ACIQGW_25685, partial [Lysinibacillus xylanilyticus]|uniref:hypothetical protein n=1 Tax=Lysinibacillus xylanilyticus TaxID=582475 RepID=UPI0038144BBF
MSYLMRLKWIFVSLLAIFIIITAVPSTSAYAANSIATPGNDYTTAWGYENAININQVIDNSEGQHWYKLVVKKKADYDIILSVPSNVKYSLTLYNGISVLGEVVSQNKQSISRSLLPGTYYIKVASTDGSVSSQTYNLKTNATFNGFLGGPSSVTSGGQIVETSGGNLYIDGEIVKNFSWSSSYTYDRRPSYGSDYENWSQSISPLSGGVIVSNSYRVGSYTGYEIGKGAIVSTNAIEVRISNFYYYYYYYQSAAYNSLGEKIRDSSNESYKEDHKNDFVRVIIDADTKKVIDTDRSYAYEQFNRTNSFVSYDLNVPIPLTEAVAPTGFAVDLASEKVTGTSNLMEYSTNGTSWTAITGNELNISTIIPAATAANDLALKIRMKKSADLLASQATDVIIARRLPTPLAANVKFEGINETIILDDTMEYRLGTTGDYTAVGTGVTSISVDVGTAALNYQVRIKATNDKFASAPLTVSVAKRAAAPAAVYNASSDAITGVSTAIEYSLDDGKTWISIAASSIPRTVFGNDVTVVKVRVKATEKAAKSEIKEVAVPSGPKDSP